MNDIGGPLPARANEVYRTRNVLGRDTLYMNWGLWDAATRDMDVAVNLRHSEAINICPEQTIIPGRPYGRGA